MIAVDSGLLAYALNRYAPEHTRAASVVEALVNGDRRWALPWPALHGFLASVTHPHRVARPLAAEDAVAFVATLLAAPTVTTLGPGPRHLRILGELMAETGGGRLPEGVELAAVLREHGVREILSTDRELERYRFLTVIDPLHGEEWAPSATPARRYRVLAPGRASEPRSR
jgi:toxin-antitoxin system PIN domain toxin